MTSLTIASISFACIFASALFGMYAASRLPEHHLSSESKDVVKVATGLVATIAALVLGLLISSARTSFDRTNNELTEVSAKIVVLDRVLAAYGAEAQSARAGMKKMYAARVDALLSSDVSRIAALDSPEVVAEAEALQATLRQLPAQNDVQRTQRDRAVHLISEVSENRWLILLHKNATIPMPLLVVLVSWLAIIFAAFGLFSPRNGTVMIALMLCALSSAGAIFLILEMDQPLGGVITINPAPLLEAVAHLGQQTR